MKNKWIASLTASFILTLSLSAIALNQSPAPDVLPPIIPKPAQIQSAPGAFNMSPKTPVICAQEIVETAKLAAAELGLENVSVAEPADKAINLGVDQSLQPEAYRLKITPARITVTGGSQTGVYYGIQSLRQTLPFGPMTQMVALNGLSVSDQPRFAWRGLMLDCSRTFQSLGYLKTTVDRLAYYKMNILHLHLTDDQGWRMEIKKHPELTRKAARFSPQYDEPESHQGFYTQTELRDLVKYAQLHGVTLVPEIEMPGHSLEVLVCRPDLSCSGKIPDDIFPFFKGPSITRDIFCAGNDDTFKFLEDVIDEVADIFPSTFIHIGGDEAPKERWKACPKCQARLKAEGLKDEHELQSYFIRRVEKQINAKGRRLIGWSEILEGGLAPNAAVMDWIGGAAEATQAGHDAVMSPTSHCYFDYSYKSISTEKVYAFNPVAKLSPDQAQHLLGIQANFWSHIDREPALVDRQLFPRLISLAERAWSPAETTDWSHFKSRLDAHLPILEKMDIRFYKSPVASWSQKNVPEQ